MIRMQNLSQKVECIDSATCFAYSIRLMHLLSLSPLRLTLLLSVAFLLCLGLHPYITPSEARYIEIARQMVVSGDWIIPHINGVPYFEKPPLFYWMEAGMFSLFGWGEFSGRLLTALLSVALCMLTYALASVLYTRREGVAAALVLATTWLGFSLSRVVMLDVPLTVCVTATMLCFIMAAREEKPRAWVVYTMYVAAALGMLAKGLVAIALPGMIVLAWLVLTKRWALLLKLRLPTGIVLFLVIALPWHIAAGARYPEFWKFYFLHEHFSRFLTDVHRRVQPWWFFIAVLTVGAMPWLPLMLRALWQERRNREPYRVLLLLWAVLPFLFFSSSHSKLIPYIYPCFPPLAVLITPHLLQAWQRRDLFARICVYAAALTAPLGYMVQVAAPHYSRGSVKAVATELAPQLTPDDEVVIYGNYRQDLPLYLNRNVTVVDYKGELEFGTTINSNTKRWMIDSNEFITRCKQSGHTMYVLVSENTLPELQHRSCSLHMVPLTANPPEGFVLLTNKDK